MTKAIAGRLISLCLLLFLFVSGSLLYAGFLSRKCQEQSLLVESTGEPGIANVHDFVLFYAEGKLAQEAGGAENLYDRRKYNQVIAAISYPLKPYSEFGFQYPPFFIPALSALARLPLNQAYSLWVSLSLLIQISCALLICRGQTVLSKLLAVSSSLLAFPAFSNIFEGQTAAYLLFPLTLLFLLLRSKKYFLAGLASGLGFLKIQYAPALLLIGFCAGRWNYLKGAVLAGITLFLLTAWGAGLPSLIDYPRSLLLPEISGGGHMDAGGMANFRAALHILLGLPNKIELAISGLLYLFSLIATAWVWLRFYPLIKENREHAFEIAASLSVLLILAFGIHVWIYDYLAAMIPCFWLSRALLSDFGKSPRPGLGILLLGLLFGFPILTFPSVLILLTQGQGWWVCSLWSCLVVILTVFYLRTGPQPRDFQSEGSS